jgi:MFS family permease
MRNRHYWLLWLVSVATTLAIELFTITILVTIFNETGSTLQAAGTMVARTLPAVLLGPVAGVLVDRFSRKHVLIGMDFLRLTLVAGAVWLLGGTETVPVAASYLLLAGLSGAAAFHQPARLAMIPSLVPSWQLARANSVILASSQVVMAVSYTLGGWLILAVPLRVIALIVVALFALGVGAAALLTAPERRRSDDSGPEETFLGALSSGWHYLRQHPIARPLTIMETAEHLPHGIWTGALLLAFTAQALGGDAADWGYQVTGYFGGMIVGSLAALAWSGWLHRRPGWIIIVNACAAGAFTLAYAGSQTIGVAVVLATVFGPPFAIRDVAQDVLLQGTVADNQLGRVYATRETLRSLVFMFAGLFFAWLSDLVPIRTIYVAGGLLYLLTGLYALSNKALRESSVTAVKREGAT